jgi:nicotinamidase/pyrazinamidase
VCASLGDVTAYDPATALVVVDMQNDFADPAGSLSVAGGEAIVPAVNSEIAAAKEAGATIVYTQDWHPAHTPHFAQDGGPWPVHCVQGTWGAALHPALTVAGPVVRKGTNGEDGYSGFTMRDPITGATVPTELEAILRGRAVGHVVVAGLATDYCVRATALDAIRLGFETTLLTGAIAAVDLQPGDGARAIDEMRAAGATIADVGARMAAPRRTTSGARAR